MMGTADPLPAAPAEKVVFMEDMNENELASALEMPAGLTNLGEYITFTQLYRGAGWRNER